MPEWIKPPRLQAGDLVAIVAPASSPGVKELKAAIEAWETAGYRVRVDRNLCDPQGYLSADDDTRVAELNRAIEDPEVRAIIAARGGYGVTRILDRIDWAALKRSPKLLAGYSDLTALHSAAGRSAGLMTLHSPNAIDVPECVASDSASGETLLGLATGAKERGQLKADPQHADAVDGSLLVEGRATGRLVGGNLAVLAGLVGTQFEPDTAGSILVLEDIGEAPYRIDRYLSQLCLAGILSRVAGVGLGYFSDCYKKQADLTGVLRGYLEKLKVPVLPGLPFGHATPNRVLAIGANYELDTNKGCLRRLESAVSD